MTGYTRADTTDQIANGNIIDAIPLDAEFNAIQTAFASVGGHTHSGAVGEGAPITTIGPSQNVVASTNSLTPKTDNLIDLGSSTYEWKDLYIDGVANIDSLIADTADINAGTIDGTVIGGTVPSTIVGTTISATAFTGGTFTGTTVNATSLVGPLTGNASTTTKLQTARSVNGTAFDGTGDITTANWGTNRTITVGNTPKTVNGSSNITWSLSEIGVGTLGQQNSTSVNITGGVINGASVGATTPSTGAFTNLSSSNVATFSTTILNSQLGLGGANYGASGQVLTSRGAGLSPSWQSAVPSGVIVLWSGASTAIPSGWLLCDGTNSTPDLRDRFVVGAGSSYAVGATGGANSVALTAAQMPTHSHTFSGTTSTSGAHSHTTSGTPAGSNGNAEINADQYGGGNSGQPDGSQIRGTSTDGNHNHTFSGTTSQSGDGQSHENRPPYYALCYIMKA